MHLIVDTKKKKKGRWNIFPLTENIYKHGVINIYDKEYSETKKSSCIIYNNNGFTLYFETLNVQMLSIKTILLLLFFFLLLILNFEGQGVCRRKYYKK